MFLKYMTLFFRKRKKERKKNVIQICRQIERREKQKGHKGTSSKTLDLSAIQCIPLNYSDNESVIYVWSSNLQAAEEYQQRLVFWG